MKVNFTDSFFDSLKKLVARERWYWKAWDYVRYDFPAFLGNIWKFRKALWSHRWYDWRSPMTMFKTSLEIMEKRMQDGMEDRLTRDKKVKKMQRVIWIMQQFTEDKFIELAEKEMGEVILKDWEFEPVPGREDSFQLVDNESEEVKTHNRAVFARARELEELHWKELWVTLEGQDYEKFQKAPEGSDMDEIWQSWEEQFDGSGLRGWWD